MQMWEILVPATQDGQPIKRKHHREWDKFVRKLSGGLTIFTPAKGQWIEKQSKKLVREPMIPVRIACEAKDMEAIAQFTLKHYYQKVVLYYEISNLVHMVEARRKPLITGNADCSFKPNEKSPE